MFELRIKVLLFNIIARYVRRCGATTTIDSLSGSFALTLERATLTAAFASVVGADTAGLSLTASTTVVDFSTFSQFQLAVGLTIDGTIDTNPVWSGTVLPSSLLVVPSMQVWSVLQLLTGGSVTVLVIATVKTLIMVMVTQDHSVGMIVRTQLLYLERCMTQTVLRRWVVQHVMAWLLT